MAKFNSELKIWESTKVPYPHSMDVYFGEIMLEFCENTPDRVIQFHHEENKALTCRELKNSSISIAKNLISIGIKSDDVVTIICRNSNFVTSFIHGCVLMGAIINPLTHQLSVDNISHLLKQTKPKLIICDPDMIPVIKVAMKLINLPLVYVTGDESVDGFQSTCELLNVIDFDFTPPKFDKKADKKMLAILCSSGTTKMQKGVCVTHATCLRYDFKKMPLRPPSKPITFSDAYWSSGFFLQLFIAFYPNDLRVWSREKFCVEKLIEIVEAHKITSINLVTSSLAAILESEKFLSCNHESLKTFMMLGSLSTETLREKFKNTFPNKLLMTSYGMTEIFVSITKPGEVYNGLSCGSIITNNLKIKIVDEKENNLGPNEKGEIRVKTQFDFLGYYNDPEETRNALDDEGFIKSGDIGFFNDNGEIFVVDRIKESFKYKNIPIFPSQIEKIIEEIKGVELVCVVGIHDIMSGNEFATAAVKLSPNSKITEKEIVDHVAKNNSEVYHLHGGVYFVQDMPMTPNGKILRRKVKEMILQKKIN